MCISRTGVSRTLVWMRAAMHDAMGSLNLNQDVFAKKDSKSCITLFIFRNAFVLICWTHLNVKYNQNSVVDVLFLYLIT